MTTQRGRDRDILRRLQVGVGTGVVLGWITLFLTNHTQQVSYNSASDSIQRL